MALASTRHNEQREGDEGAVKRTESHTRSDMNEIDARMSITRIVISIDPPQPPLSIAAEGRPESASERETGRRDNEALAISLSTSPSLTPLTSIT